MICKARDWRLELNFVGYVGTLTHRFFQIGWHFPDNPKIDGDTHRFLKSGKILNHHGVRREICFSEK